ncbi:MAG: sigma-70 family RNA polymerase sigma factor [Myxococcota bacterium]
MDDPATLLRRGYRYAVALTGDPVDAEDLLQEGWAAVLSAGDRRDAPYLYRAIRSRWIDRYRRARARPEVVLEPHEQAVSPEVDRLIEADALWAGLLQLPEPQREALYLHLVEGWTAAEIAAQTGRPRNTVLSQLHRGRAHLRDWLATHLEEAG